MSAAEGDAQSRRVVSRSDAADTDDDLVMMEDCLLFVSSSTSLVVR